MRAILLGLFMLSCVAGCAESGIPTDSVATENEDNATAVSETEIEEISEGQVEQASAEMPQEEFKIGDRAPNFADITGVDDKKHSLHDFADAKAVAVVFTCNSCPVAVAYEERLAEYQKDYADKGVQLVAINVNNDESNRLPAMKDRAMERGFSFPYLYDPTQKVARNYGAAVTPHVFLLDGQRRLAYVGPVDDNMDDAKAAKPLLREATDAVLAGKAPETAQIEPVGCGIKYE